MSDIRRGDLIRMLTMFCVSLLLSACGGNTSVAFCFGSAEFCASVTRNANINQDENNNNGNNGSDDEAESPGETAVQATPELIASAINHSVELLETTLDPYPGSNKIAQMQHDNIFFVRLGLWLALTTNAQILEIDPTSIEQRLDEFRHAIESLEMSMLATPAHRVQCNVKLNRSVLDFALGELKSFAEYRDPALFDRTAVLAKHFSGSEIELDLIRRNEAILNLEIGQLTLQVVKLIDNDARARAYVKDLLNIDHKSASLLGPQQLVVTASKAIFLEGNLTSRSMPPI